MHGIRIAQYHQAEHDDLMQHDPLYRKAKELESTKKAAEEQQQLEARRVAAVAIHQHKLQTMARDREKLSLELTKRGISGPRKWNILNEFDAETASAAALLERE